MVSSEWTCEVEPARPAQQGILAAGPVYRATGAKDGPPHLPDVSTCYELFNRSVKLYPDRPCLGSRKIVKGQAQPFTYMTYKEAGSLVANVGSALKAVGVNQQARVGVFGANCPEWMVSMQVLFRAIMLTYVASRPFRSPFVAPYSLHPSCHDEQVSV